MKKIIICCDWGTSSLRIRLVDVEHDVIIDQESSGQGSSALFGRWKQLHLQSMDLNDRINHYLGHLKLQLDNLASRNHIDLSGMLVVISGMASSSIGLMELPYAELPFSVYGDHAVVERLSPSAQFNHPILLLSGVRDGDEVMRGEETQMVGIATLLEERGQMEDMMVILPGTHSKHVYLGGQQIVSIKTYVTGELFANLTKYGLLKESVQPLDSAFQVSDWESFYAGVDDAANANILNELFKVRTNKLFDRFSKQENYRYLSGLLIGHELRNLIARKDTKILMCCSESLYPNYAHAMEHLKLDSDVYYIDPGDVDLATVKGQLKIAKRYLN